MNQLQIHDVEKVTIQTNKIESSTREEGYFYSTDIEATDKEGKTIRFNLLSDEPLPLAMEPRN